MAPNGPQVAEGDTSQTLKRSTDMEDTTNIPNEEQTGRLQQHAVVPSASSDFALKAEVDWKATEYDCAHVRLDDIGVPTELVEDGDRLSIVGRINILWRRALKAESDLETIELRHGVKV